METNTIPVINIKQIESDSTLQSLDRACEEWGFFQVIEHGIDSRIFTALQTTMSEFFYLPLEDKNQIARSEDNPWGFYDKELTKNVRDWKEIFDYGPAEGNSIRPQWPAGFPSFQQSVLDYYDACKALSLRLLAAIAQNLGAPASALCDAFGAGHTSFLRLNYYPPCTEKQENDAMGISPHTDAGALTCLLQDGQPGLEVFRDGNWQLVEPQRDALVINIGDIVQVWSNNRYKAALHRVLTNTTEARFSAPFFLNPTYSTNYKPLQSVLNDKSSARYKPINWGEFRAQRASGDYADYGQEIQISDYLRQEMDA